MSYTAIVYNLMAGGPKDVETYIESVFEAAREWNTNQAQQSRKFISTLHWSDSVPRTMGARPQDLVNKYALDKADILFAIFESRIGSSTGKEISGTVEEIRLQMSRGKPTLIFFSEIGVSISNIDTSQANTLKEFRNECMSKGLYHSFDSVEDLRAKSLRAITQLMHDFHGYIEQNEGPETEPEIDSPMKTLLVKAAEKSGQIFHMKASQGSTILAGSLKIEEWPDRRDYVIYLDALENLVTRNLVKKVSKNRYDLTSKGFTVTDDPAGSVLF